MRGAVRYIAGLLASGWVCVLMAQPLQAGEARATLREPMFATIPAAAGGSLPAFAISVTEVTVEQFAAFVEATSYRTKAEQANAGAKLASAGDKQNTTVRTWREPGYEREPGQPVTYVTALDATAYCSWVGGRLPTDEEWVLAARAGSATRHYWGDAIDGEYLWYRPNSQDRPHAVGKKRPNAFGLYDVEGNVWEWTLPNEPVTDQSLASRRGGSWVSCEFIAAAPGKEDSPLITIDVRYKVPVGLHHRYDDIGFRCVRPAK